MREDCSLERHVHGKTIWDISYRGTALALIAAVRIYANVCDSSVQAAPNSA